MRKNAGSWIVKILFSIIVIVFVFFYGFSDVGNKDQEVIASVGNKKIYVAEYRTAYKNMLQLYQNIYKNQFNDNMIEEMGLKQKVLENLIDRELLLQETERQRIKITSEDIRKEIRSSPTFQQEGVFSQGLYKKALGYYGISASDYEKDKKKELALKTLENMIKNSVIVSDREVRDVVKMKKQKVTVEYVTFNPDEIKEKPEISQEQKKEYYEKHKENFRVPEKVQVKYIVFDPRAFKDKVEVSEKELREYYELDEGQFFKPKQVRARHILLKFKKRSSEEEEELKKKAITLLEQLNKGADFEKLAKKHSEDTASADKGGDLGFFKQGDMVKPFEKIAFNLKIGETSDLVKTEYGFHIIRVEDIMQPGTIPFKEAKKKIEKEIRAEKAVELVRREAKRAFNRLFKSRDLEQYAEKKGFDLLETDYFVFGKSPEDRENKKVFSEEAFLLSPGEIAPAFTIGRKYFIIKLIDKKESDIAPFEQVSDEIVIKLAKEKKIQWAKDKAEKVLSELREGKEKWIALEKKYGLKIEETEFTRSGDYIPGIGKINGLKSAVFSLDKAPSYATTFFQTSKGVFLVKLVEKEVVSDDVFETESEKTAEEIIQNKKNECFDRFLQKLKTKTEIKVNTNMI
ncbi:MAG: SurA N-terminal domain-containing protein [Alphaproteobacteria bacterium]